MQFTADQQKVISTRNKNILVSAAAGSGKTAVLVQRILSLITDIEHPVDIDRLLIVTFTSAAAAEMRERVHSAILKRLEEHPDDANLQRQATLIHNAQITTIDSFCLFLLRNHFHEIDLDPAFRVGDPGEVKLIEKQVLSEVLEEFYAQGEQGFLAFADAFCPDGKDGKLEAMVEELYQYSMSHPWPIEWLDACDQTANKLTEDNLFQSEWMKYGMTLAQENTKEALTMAKRAMEICELSSGPYMYAETLEDDIRILEQLVHRVGRCTEIESYEQVQAVLSDIKWKRLPIKSDDSVLVEHREEVKGLRERYKKIVTEMRELYFVSPWELIYEKEKIAQGLQHTLICVTKAYIDKLGEVKKEKNILDFSDVEHYALNILIREGEPTKTALWYQEHYREVMIDEYQDSNMVQELLLSAVSCEKDGQYNRFMVGDMKQSIYRFRLARPEIFMEKYNRYQNEEKNECLICLKKNFRSREEVLTTTNAVFAKIMRPQIGGVMYDEEAALYVGAEYPQTDQCETELCIYEVTKDDELGKRKAEAYMIAQKIRELMQTMKIGERQLAYRDIVILLRSGTNIADEILSVLMSEGIPAYVTSNTGYFSAPEVTLLMNMLRILNNPYDDLAFCSVATSLFFRMTEEELAMIRATTARGVTLYESFREALGKEESSLSKECLEKIKDALGLVAELRDEAVVRSMTELVNGILARFHYIEYVAALPAGEQRKANVAMFVEKTVDFEKTSFHGLFQFIRYMEQLKKYEVDYGEAATLAENADVVRIMTIHKSKGLEFPVCFVAGLDKRYNLRDTTGTMLVDADWGIASDYVLPEKNRTGKTLRKMLLAQKMKRDSIGEELRILYVAMTRAKEKLILTAAQKDPEKKRLQCAALVDGRSGEIPISAIAEAGSNLTYLLMVCAAEESCMKVTYWAENDLKLTQVEQLMEKSFREDRLRLLEGNEKTEEIQERLEELQERFDYVYPHGNLSALYTKTSVSELKHAAMREEHVPVMFETEDAEKSYLPAFMREEKVMHEGAARGSAMHRLLELIDFESYRKWMGDQKEEAILQRLYQDIASWVEEGRISEEYAKLISETKIVRFLRTDIVRRMAEAQSHNQLFREQAFVLAVGADELNPDYPPEEKVLIQGIIDVYFEEEDGIVILDYKTDKVMEASELKERYRTQLDYYDEAISRLTQKPVKEKVLYSFSLMEEVSWK